MQLTHTAKTRLVATLVALMLPLALAAPASAQQQTGLVNVAVVGNTIQAPVAVAANICGLQVNVLAQGVAQGPVTCTALSTATAQAVAVRQPGGGGGNQNGLINIIVADNVVQIPIAAAANVCGIQVNVLAQFVNQQAVACTANANSRANA
jgi:hypothetical protein